MPLKCHIYSICPIYLLMGEECKYIWHIWTHWHQPGDKECCEQKTMVPMMMPTQQWQHWLINISWVGQISKKDQNVHMCVCICVQSSLLFGCFKKPLKTPRASWCSFCMGALQSPLYIGALKSPSMEASWCSLHISRKKRLKCSCVYRAPSVWRLCKFSQRP